MEYNCVLIKEVWLDACVALGVVGAVLVAVLQHWSKIRTILQTWEARTMEMSQTLLKNEEQENLG